MTIIVSWRPTAHELSASISTVSSSVGKLTYSAWVIKISVLVRFFNHLGLQDPLSAKRVGDQADLLGAFHQFLRLGVICARFDGQRCPGRELRKLRDARKALKKDRKSTRLNSSHLG